MTPIATTLLDELDLGEDERRALSEEAVRLGVPVDLFISKTLLEKAREIRSAAGLPPGPSSSRPVHAPRRRRPLAVA